MVATAAAVGSALAGLVGAGSNLFKGQQQQVDQGAIANAQMQMAANNQRQQALVQALVNQRAVAGSQDSFGSSMRYDPATNTWVSQLGPLPQAADTAAMQAGVTRNTTDVQNQELANREALKRAAAGGSAADTAQRELQQFRPMQSGDLAGLLQAKATTAANQTFQPLVADTLRSFARTGTAAGPVLAQLGREQSDNLRKSLIDSQIAAMTGTEQINQSRRQGLETTAANTSNLANPTLQAGGVTPSGQNAALQTALTQRANSAGYTTAAGASGPNNALTGMNAATNTAIGHVVDPNLGLSQLSSGAKDLSAMFGTGGSGLAALQKLFGGSSNSGNSGDRGNIDWSGGNDQWQTQ